jgi:hypothetical protein
MLALTVKEPPLSSDKRRYPVAAKSGNEAQCRVGEKHIEIAVIDHGTGMLPL